MLLVIYVGSQLLSFYLSTTAVQSKSQRYIFMALPFLFIPFVINFPVGLMIYWVTTNLWTVGQGLVTRRLYPRPTLELPKRTSRTPPPRRRRRRRRGEVEGAEALASDDSGEGTGIGERHRPAARAPAEEEGLQGQAMSETDVGPPGTGDPDREAEAAGETVGEAKWTALRELERRFPGLDKAKVEFVVLSEGERGLLGVGFVPARVIARVGGELPVAPSLPAEPEDEGDAELSGGRHPAQAVPRARSRRARDRGLRVDPGERRDPRRDVPRPRARPRDRQARADDRRDPAARRGDSLPCGRATAGRRRRRSRLPGPATRRGRVTCRPDGVAGGRNRAGRRARADEHRRSARSCTSGSRIAATSSPRAAASSRTGTWSSDLLTDP